MSPHPAAVAAADWWTERVTGIPSRRAVTGEEPRAEREPMELAAMMSILALPDAPDDEAAEKFRTLLTEHVDDLLARGGDWITLSCDYGPGRALADAAEAAGVDYGRFPWKTCMWIHPDHVTAYEGYQAPTRIVWHADDWQRPKCGQEEWDEVPTGRVCRLPQYHEEQHDYEVTDAKCSECGDGLKGHSYATKDHAWRAAS